MLVGIDAVRAGPGTVGICVAASHLTHTNYVGSSQILQVLCDVCMS
jgi:hypothetical protein